MLGKRLLVISNLLVAVPDNVMSKDGRDELTIDEILEWLIRYRKSSDAVARNNRYGNFLYFSADMPKEMNPEDTESFTAEALMQYLSDTDDDKKVAGMMTSLIYDEDFGSYRNAYTKDEDAEFQRRKAQLIATAGAQEEADDPTPCCDECDNICDENCPMDSTDNDNEE